MHIYANGGSAGCAPRVPSGFDFFFFFNDTATTEIYTLSLHDALPISRPPTWNPAGPRARAGEGRGPRSPRNRSRPRRDRKSTRLNSSHLVISYAVFCLKKKTKNRHLQMNHHPSHSPQSL